MALTYACIFIQMFNLTQPFFRTDGGCSVKTDQSTIEVSRTTGKKKRLLNAQSLSNS